MIPETMRRTAVTLTIGGCGAALAALAEMPAAPLIGASLATSAAAWGGLRLALDSRLRDAGVLVIGLSLGSGFGADALDHAGEWALSLVLLCLSILATLLVSRWLLVRFWRKDRMTALLATSPGTMSLALSIAAEGKGDATTIVIMQAMRLLILAAVLPLLVAGAGAGAIATVHREEFDIAGFGLLALFGTGVALILKRAGFPAAFLAGGMIASAVAHAGGIVHGLSPYALLFAGFTITGSVIGSRFSAIKVSAVLQLLRATFATVGTAALVSAAFAAVVSVLTGLPIGQVWIAFAPGGVEAMAAIGLAMGFNPAYVALHHLVRIGFLIVLLPILSRGEIRSARSAK